MIQHFLVDDQYQVTYIPNENLLILEFSLPIKNENLKASSGYIDFNLESKYGRIVKIEICKTKISTFLCTVFLALNKKIENENEITNVYNDLKVLLTNVI
ncbi:hypothetical protein DFR86_09485 [Acidianus sulfidivorans JP7]|uniref:Uncharacterized protein n=1 Tax=Acidianus sulfidivorans JP7 TaxID=619593 RepID=A0A2U9IP47_9CREN|nr:hypothetical protein [Acidianus sulfidivorans]AWR97754.1 hypothetical protein DFR86_09485 [Acidianus sulfidivorans JP7]